jgi:cardiolipin synthase
MTKKPYASRRRPLLAIGGMVLAGGFFLVYQRVLSITEKPSWPPPPGAITSDGSQDAVEAFAARSDPGARDVGLPFAWSTAATIDPWPEGKNFFPRIFADVEKAQSSVHILMFGWREGEVGTKLTDLLVQKMKQGVEVRVIVDAAGSKPYGPTKPMFTKLADAGAQIVVNDVFPWDRDGLYPNHTSFDLSQDDVGRADHRKLYVIDGKLIWIGGAGIEDHFQNGKFHDVMARVTGDVVRQAQALFLMSFRAHHGPLPTDLSKYFPTQPDPGTTPVALLQVVPGGFVSATQAIRSLVDHAHARLDIMNPYFTDADIVQRVLAAARRGVTVRIVVSGTSNNAQATDAFKHHYSDLIDAGAQIWEYPAAVVHAKLVVADDTAVFGTVNFDAWALYRNFEIALMARSAAAAALLEERVFQPDIARSHAGTPPAGLRAQLSGWLWDRLAYFL